MLNGNEKIKDLTPDDICNWLGNGLSGIGTVKVQILTKREVLFIEYSNGTKTIITLTADHMKDATIQEVKDLAIWSKKNFEGSMKHG